MISVSNLSKRFGTTKAVDGVSFEISHGQIVGFLGPNGAGKTTTMRLLTGYLPADDGEAKILGHDLRSESIEIRKRLGYLPENNPLPDDIEVTDFLHYIGVLRGLTDPTDRMDRVRRVLKTCSLGAVVGKKLGELSKGYRQRVGLAQAIIHDPDVLILDEPTSGLDPNQVLEVRELIQRLKSQKTLLISTHILSEVQSTCDRVIIINKGKVAADGSPNEIGGSIQNSNRLTVSMKGPKASIQDALEKMEGVIKVFYRDATDRFEESFLIESDSSKDLRTDVFELAVKKKWPILGMKQERLELEEIFRTLTKES